MAAHTHKDGFRFFKWGQRGTLGAAIPSSLALHNLSCSYDVEPTLKHISLEIKAGELICLLGPSGCGKTTLLRLIAGLERPSQGNVTVDGLEVSGTASFVAPEQRGMGFMFQDYALFPHLTVLQNVMFGLRDLSRQDKQATALRALSRVGLQHVADDYPHRLSGGEQQRVALARTIAPRPGVVLMDEPFSNLDRRLRDQIREETIGVLRETGATTIIVTHDPEEAMRIADRIVLMRKGSIVQSGLASTLYREPASLFAARFFCDFNEVEGICQQGVVRTAIGSFAAPHLGDEKALVCIRQQGISLKQPGSAPNALPGRILSKRFLGEVDMLHVAVDGLDQPMQARLRCEGSMPQLKAGQDVEIEIDPHEVLVFAASSP